MDRIREILTSTINEEGIDYLQWEPYKMYQRLVANGIDSSYAGLVLITLLAGAVESTQRLDEEELSKFFQKECFLRKKAADQMTAMYKHLFSPDNLISWKNRENTGFEELCESTWEFEWEGSGRWERNGGHYDCSATVTVDVKVKDKDLALKALEKILLKNPFTDSDTLFELLQKKMEAALQEDFEEYIESDDYYPPVMEDYDAEYGLNKCCQKLGLKITYIGTKGSMSDYEYDDRW